MLEYALSDLWRTQDYSEAKRLEAKFIYYVDDKPHVRKDIDFGSVQGYVGAIGMTTQPNRTIAGYD